MKDNHIEDILELRAKELKAKLPEMPVKIRTVNVKLNKNLVMLDPFPVQDKIVNGIIIPESVQKDKVCKGAIIAVGSEVSEYAIGDIVAYDINTCTPLIIDEKDTFLIYPSNIYFTYTNTRLGY